MPEIFLSAKSIYYYHSSSSLVSASEDSYLPCKDGGGIAACDGVIWAAGTLTVEEVFKDRDSFAALVREVAAPDVGRMGIEILSFTIKDVYDNVEYLSSLGRPQTAIVKRDANTGVAFANRDAGIRVSPPSSTAALSLVLCH